MVEPHKDSVVAGCSHFVQGLQGEGHGAVHQPGVDPNFTSQPCHPIRPVRSSPSLYLRGSFHGWSQVFPSISSHGFIWWVSVPAAARTSRHSLPGIPSATTTVASPTARKAHAGLCHQPRRLRLHRPSNPHGEHLNQDGHLYTETLNKVWKVSNGENIS